MYRIISSTNSEIDNEGNIVPQDIAIKLSGSKIRNRKGQLIVCYHGTNANFEELKEDLISSNSGNIGWFGRGFYFTNCKPMAQRYGSNLKRCYLNITHPFIYSSEDSIYELYALGVEPRVYDGRLQPYAYLEDETPIDVFTQAIKDAGYDGVKFSYRQGHYRSNVPGTSDAIEYVCFRPDQAYFF